MPEISITDEELMRALMRLIFSRWKYLLALFFVFAIIFAGGGWYVYNDAKIKTTQMQLETHQMILELIDDVAKAKAKAKELLEIAERDTDEYNKRVDLIAKKLEHAQTVLDENIEILNDTIEQTIEQQQTIQQQIPEEKSINKLDKPKLLRKPALKKYNKK